jgi:hypothetical protein
MAESRQAARPGFAPWLRWERARSRFLALPEGWLLQKLFHAMLVASVAGMLLDAAGLIPGTESGPGRQADRPEPVEVTRPTPGDNLRPYQPDMVPRPGPGRQADPVLPDGTPIVDEPFERMSFTRADVNGVPAILAVGDILTGTAEEFRRFDDTGEGQARLVVLMSRGGIVSEAVEMGERIRERGMTALVPQEGFCFSSCPLMLAGGTERQVYPDAWVGVHRSRLVQITGTADAADAWEAGQGAVARIMDYLESMEVDPLVWRLALQTPFEEIYMLSAEELLDTRLATRVDDTFAAQE